MDNNIIKNIQPIADYIAKLPQKVCLIAVSKLQDTKQIIKAIDAGIINFGENYLDEAQNKWIDIKKAYPHIKLHFIGNLQSNKINKIMQLFDVIHSINSTHSASKIKHYLDNNRYDNIKEFFIQTKILNDASTKAGVPLENLDEIITYCKNIQLNINGLMYISTAIENSDEEFKIITELNKKYDFKYLSMGMSNDYQTALNQGATHIRIGTKIFGNR